MDNQNSTNLLCRAVIIICSVVSIALLCGNWLEPIYSDLLDSSSSYGYSLFDISEFLDNINMLLNKEELELFSLLLSFGAALTIALYAITIISALSVKNRGRIFTFSTVFGLLLPVFFLVVVFVINSEFQDSFYSDLSILNPTLNPILLIILSIVIDIFSITKKNAPSRPAETVGSFCANCGFRLPGNASFCPGCGERIAGSKLSTLAKEHAEKLNSEKTLKNGGWECAKCGKANPSYTGTCSCGNSKHTQ